MQKKLRTFKRIGVNQLKTFLCKIGYYSKPDFMIIGAQKAGTTGLFNTLNNHSLIIGSSGKEIHYFDNDLWYSKKQLHSYHSYFPLPHNVPQNARLFEATPIYLFHPLVAERLYKYNPKLKLIVLLRDPAHRAFSAWTMYHHHLKTGPHKNSHDPRPFDVAIKEELKNIQSTSFYENKIAYVKRGIYHNQIEEYLKYFPIEQLLFVESHALKKQPQKTLKSIYDFIEVPNNQNRLIKSNKSKVSQKEIYEKDIQILKDFYSTENEKLYKLIGSEYNWNE